VDDSRTGVECNDHESSQHDRAAGIAALKSLKYDAPVVGPGELPGDVALELINFNPLASGKYRALDLPYDFAELTAPLDQEIVDTLSRTAREEGVTVV
jgi:hypothetical protein